MEIPARVQIQVRRLGSHEGPAILHWRTPDDGSPSCQWSIDRHPIEVRVWHREPDGYEAVRHPSGVWMAIRVL